MPALSFKPFVHAVDDRAVRSRAADAKENSGRRGGMASRCVAVRWEREAQRDSAHGAAGNQPRRVRNVPRDAEFFGQNVGRSGGQQRHRHLAAGKPVHHFVDRAVAAAGDHHAAALLDGLSRDLRGAEPGRWWARVSVAMPASFRMPRGLLDLVEAAMAPAARSSGCRSGARL